MKKDSFLTRHLHEADENYFVHLAYTTKTALMLIISGIVVFIHGLVPFLFVHTGSCMIEAIYAGLKTRREACEKNRKA